MKANFCHQWPLLSPDMNPGPEKGRTRFTSLEALETKQESFFGSDVAFELLERYIQEMDTDKGADWLNQNGRDPLVEAWCRFQDRKILQRLKQVHFPG